MTRERIEAIYDRFPELFQLRGEYPRRFRGIECDEGWFPIIEEMCEELRKLSPVPDIFQIKEKFAGLRCYFQSGCYSEEAEAIVERAAQRCAVTCEICGHPGERIISHGVMKVVCEDHANFMEERLKRYE